MAGKQQEATKMESDGRRARTGPRKIMKHRAAGRQRLEQMSGNEIGERTKQAWQ